MRLEIPVTAMTPSIMEWLEQQGKIIRLLPGHHAFLNPRNGGEGRPIYEASAESGPHTLLSCSVDRTSFVAFGMHNENEEFLLLGMPEEKQMYLMIGLCAQEILEEKARKKTLRAADFICLRCKNNDPHVSFFTMLAGVPHGEACAKETAFPATFYVTEPKCTTLVLTQLASYEISVQEAR